MIIPIFLPHLGCIERCIYCNQGYITNTFNDDIRFKVRNAIGTIKISFEVGLYGGNIFNVEPHILKRIFSYFKPYEDRIKNFRISTKPVPLKKDIIDILKANHVTVIELGMPTFNNNILQTLNRQHTVSEFFEAFHELKKEGFDVAVQVMVGLPGEAWNDIRQTANAIIRLKPNYIRIYPLVVLSGTALEIMYTDGNFIPISFGEALDRATYIYLTTLQDGITTVKIGLTDNEIVKDKVIGGNYHPAFGYLVRSRAFYLGIKTLIDTHALKGDIVIHINKIDISHLIGDKRSNIVSLESSGINVKWIEDAIKEGTFVIEDGRLSLTGNIFDALMFFQSSQ